LPSDVRVPHIGWNEVEVTEAPGAPAPGATEVLETGYFYFDHSFAVAPEDPEIVAGWCGHGVRFAAAIQSGSLLGVQFHPEKSGEAGIGLLNRWVDTVARTKLSTMERQA
jgi:imidazole glycerol phosphate synthase glutamine amidotransferase subunit